ncbi:MAG: hypothetical protein Q4P34_08375 [Tissierellia bacterium]|nr:hypothetical protein [Tissierellia bacterium]
MKFLKKIRTLLIIVAIAMVCTLIIPPVFNKFFNKIEPWIFGLPFLIFWIITINIVIALILLALWIIDNKLEEVNDNA